LEGSLDIKKSKPKIASPKSEIYSLCSSLLIILNSIKKSFFISKIKSEDFIKSAVKLLIFMGLSLNILVIFFNSILFKGIILQINSLKTVWVKVINIDYLVIKKTNAIIAIKKDSGQEFSSLILLNL
jgi:hypothetical protein